MELGYLFRRPIFPMLGSIEGYFIGAKRPRDLSDALAVVPINKGGCYSLVDYTGEVWSLLVDQMILSPLSFKKRQTKLEIIRLFNERRNTEAGTGRLYPETSLSSKRFDRIFSDLINLSSGIVKKTHDPDPNPAASGSRLKT